MFHVTQLAGFGSSTRSKPSRSFQAITTDTTNLITYTFASTSLGSASSERVICVYVDGISTGGARTISGVTIAGVTATLATAGTNTTLPTAMYYAQVPSGTSGSVVVTFSNTMNEASIVVWALYNVNPTPLSTGLKSTVSLFPSINFGGDSIGLFGEFSNGIGTNWTNATEDADDNYSSGASYQGGGNVVVSNDYFDSTLAVYTVWRAL